MILNTLTNGTRTITVSTLPEDETRALLGASDTATGVSSSCEVSTEMALEHLDRLASQGWS
jgi:hypothetical protein